MCNIFFKRMRSIDPRFTYLLTLSQWSIAVSRLTAVCSATMEACVFIVTETVIYDLGDGAAQHTFLGGAVLGSVVVRASDLRSRDREFDSRPVHCRVA